LGDAEGSLCPFPPRFAHARPARARGAGAPMPPGVATGQGASNGDAFKAFAEKKKTKKKKKEKKRKKKTKKTQKKKKKKKKKKHENNKKALFVLRIWVRGKGPPRKARRPCRIPASSRALAWHSFSGLHGTGPAQKIPTVWTLFEGPG